jgi:type 1 fimbria pilin
MKTTILLLALLTTALLSDTTLAPDGTYISSDTYTLTPSGTYVSGDGYDMAPDGTYVSHDTSDDIDLKIPTVKELMEKRK